MSEVLDPARIVGEGSIAPRARFSTDAPLLSLNGDWRFRLSPSASAAPQEFAAEQLDDGDWTTIPVPSSWPMQGHGAPAYTNTRFPFPIDPPAVPDENPVGDFRRTFTWEADDTAAVLRLDGVDAQGDVRLNGVPLGITAGSRLVHEFDVTGVLRRGVNTVAVRVVQWAATSYLEDQDMWWLPGIFRDVAVQATPAGGLQDIAVRADLVDGVPVLRVDAETRDGAVATVDVSTFGLSGLATGAEHPIPDAPLWTAETPDLVELTVTTGHETATLRVGFRTISIEDAQLKVNGRRIRFRGVNRHEHHPDLGRVVPPEVLRAELLLMKQHNINAIRTSHYPPHPDMPGLADELGFWLIDECDLETHGFVHVDWRGNPSDDAAWEPAYLDRMHRTVQRDRNHPSVILWSLGNEAGTGRNLAAAARLAKALDPSRPLHYEGDWSSTSVDVYSRMYAHQDEVEAIGRQAEEPLANAAADAHRRALPFLLCEYAHAMGNGPGGMSEYETSFRRFPRTQGGFVWEWLEHGIRRHTADGREFYAYGGDFGEPIHDGNFVADGLVDADRRPRPGLLDYKKVVEPVELVVAADRSSVAVTNRHDFVGLEHLVVGWRLDDGPETPLAVPVVGPGDAAQVVLPESARGAGVLTIAATLAAATAWAPAGHEVAWAQAGSFAPAGTPEGKTAPRSDGDVLRLGPAEFDPVTGRLQRIGRVETPGPEVALWRAPTDNDRGVGTDRVELPSDAAAWAAAGLDRLRTRVVSVDASADALVVVTHVGPASIDARVAVTAVWRTDGETLRLDLDAAPQGEWPSEWARFGLEFLLPWSPDDITWDGYGPGQRYPDTGQSQRLGRFRVASALELHTDYVKPQENGSRAGVTRLEVVRDGAGFAVEGAAFSFTASPWTSAELDRARHPVDLPPGEARCRLVVDLAEHGIGTAACGPGVLPQYRLAAAPVSATLVFRPLSAS